MRSRWRWPCTNAQASWLIWTAHLQSLWVSFLGGAVGAGFVVFALENGKYGITVLGLPLLLAMILHFAYRNATGRVEDQVHHLAELNRLHLSTVESLAHAIDAKDSVTHSHIRRVQSFALVLAKRIGLNEEAQLKALEAAALLHDIGKLAVPEHILNKPGRLTAAEFEKMKTHAPVGAEILAEVDFPISGRSHRPAPSRELGWHGLSRWHQRDRHSNRRPDPVHHRLL